MVYHMDPLASRTGPLAYQMDQTFFRMDPLDTGLHAVAYKDHEVAHRKAGHNDLP